MAKTVKEVIDILSAFPQDSFLVLSSDAEGNNFHHFTEASNEFSFEPESYYVELADPYEFEEDQHNVVVMWP